jgi:hypothetical protein
MKNITLSFAKISAFIIVLVSLVAPRISFAAEQGSTVSGEVVDLMCYLDHGAKGAKHAGCCAKCISSGGPVGILTSDNQLYLVIGSHKPMNDELAAYSAKTITVSGKLVERNGVKMVENAEIQK